MKPGLWKLIWRIVKLTLILFFGLSIFWVVLYRFVNPPFTFLMISRGFERKSDGKDWKIEKRWIDFDSIADPMKRAAVAAEDQKFLDHFGFDLRHPRSRCAPARRIGEDMPEDDIARVDDREAVREHRLRLGRETGDQVGADGNLGSRGLDALDQADRVGAQVPPLHPLQDHVVAGL